MTEPSEIEREPYRLVAISAGVSDPSSTRMLVDRVAQKTIDHLSAAGHPSRLGIIDLAPLAVDVTRAIIAGFPTDEIQSVIEKLASADAIIAATPVYKAGMSGMFKSFIDLLDNDLLIAKPVVLAATAGTARHAMVVDEQMRPLFAYLRALVAPTSLFAAPEDFSAPELGRRIDRAAWELAQLTLSGTGRAITDEGWAGYRHQFGGNATRAERSADDLDFDTELMRLATGGSLPSDR